MTEELNRNLNAALELIERREKLLGEISGCLEAETYLNSPQITYRDYKRKYVPQAKPWQIFRNLTFIIFILYSILYFIFGSFVDYILMDDEYLFKIFMALVIFGTVCYGIRKRQYNIYILGDKTKREQYQKQIVDLEDTRSQLESLEAFMSNPRNCIIPQKYWHQAYEIVAYIRRGHAENIEEAVDLLREDIRLLHTKDAK